MHIQAYVYVYIFLLNIQIKTYHIHYPIPVISVLDLLLQVNFFPFYLDTILDLVNIVFNLNYIITPREPQGNFE